MLSVIVLDVVILSVVEMNVLAPKQDAVDVTGHLTSIFAEKFANVPVEATAVVWRRDTQHNDTRHNDAQHNDTQHRRLICGPQHKGH
jgi:hypothetical protein